MTHHSCFFGYMTGQLRPVPRPPEHTKTPRKAGQEARLPIAWQLPSKERGFRRDQLMQILYFILLLSLITLCPEPVSSDAYVITDPTPIVQIENNMIYILNSKEF